MIHPAVDAPFFVVAFLRFLQQHVDTVNLFVEGFHDSGIEEFVVPTVDEACKPWVGPHPVCPFACVAISVFRHQFVYGAGDAPVVVVGDVVVPKRSPVE